jgi:hypothetical protein
MKINFAWTYFDVHSCQQIDYLLAGICFEFRRAHTLSRPAVVYVVMLVVLVAGLWTVLSIGRHLHAPRDLAGKWQLIPLSPGAKPQLMTVEQSGLFFQVGFEKGPPLDLKLKDDSKQILTGKNCQLTFTGPTDDDKTVELTGKQSGRWTAHRTLHAFPADVESKEAR